MISVIIPIYNVKAWLPKCLESLADQSFPDVEFLLIDDGSTDGSGEIADAYADADQRFFVFHTDNHGLSAARNFGVEKARGEWLMFVDSDDCVTPDFCERPYQAAMREWADLVIFMSEGQGDKGRTITGIVDAETAVRDGSAFAWNKLYSKKLFDSIRYPEGRVYEDLATTHQLIFEAKRILMLPDVLYYRTNRNGSITNIHTAKNKRDGFWASLVRAEFLKTHGCGEELWLPMVRSYALSLLARAYPSDDPLFRQAEAVVDSIKGFPSDLKWKKNLMLCIWNIDRRLFHLICRILRLKDESDRHFKAKSCKRKVHG